MSQDKNTQNKKKRKHSPRMKRGKTSPRSQAKPLHEPSLQAAPILSALMACPLPLLRAQTPPATPARQKNLAAALIKNKKNSKLSKMKFSNSKKKNPFSKRKWLTQTLQKREKPEKNTQKPKNA